MLGQPIGLTDLKTDRITAKHCYKTWLFAMIEARAKSFHNRRVCAFDGCVHFETHTPFAG